MGGAPSIQCMNPVVLAMGCGGGTSAQAQASTTATLSTIQNVLQINSTSLSQAGLLSQTLTVNYAGATINGSITISQLMNANLSFVSSTQSTITTQLLQALTSQMEQSASSMSSQQEQLLSQALNGSSVSNLMTSITDTMQTTFQSEEFQSLMQTYDVGQTLTINFAGATINGAQDITQNMIIVLQAQAIANMLQSALLQNTLVAAVSNTVQATATGSSTGLQGLISSLFTGPMLVVLVVVVLVGIAYYMSRHKSRTLGFPQPAGIMAATVPARGTF